MRVKQRRDGNAAERMSTMKVQYIGDTKKVQTIKGKEISIVKDAEFECMEKEYHSATTVRVLMSDGEHVKIKRSELKKK